MRLRGGRAQCGANAHGDLPSLLISMSLSPTLFSIQTQRFHFERSTSAVLELARVSFCGFSCVFEYVVLFICFSFSPTVNFITAHLW